MKNIYKRDKNESDSDSDKNSKTKFDGYDHHIWKFEISNKLESKGLWDIVSEGKITTKAKILGDLSHQIDVISSDVTTTYITDPEGVNSTSTSISNMDKNLIRDLNRQISNIDEIINKLDKRALLTIYKSLTKS